MTFTSHSTQRKTNATNFLVAYSKNKSTASSAALKNKTNFLKRGC